MKKVHITGAGGGLPGNDVEVDLAAILGERLTGRQGRYDSDSNKYRCWKVIMK